MPAYMQPRTKQKMQHNTMLNLIFFWEKNFAYGITDASITFGL